MQQRAAGIDDRPVIPDRDEKQISAEETFETDIGDHQRLRAEVVRLADKACARLRAKQLPAVDIDNVTGGVGRVAQQEQNGSCHIVGLALAPERGA